MAGQLRVRGMGKGAGAITSQMVTLHTGFPLTPGHPGITPGLDRLDFGQLLRQRFFRCKNVVDFLISFPCNAGQPAPQIVDGVSGGIEGAPGRTRGCLLRSTPETSRRLRSQIRESPDSPGRFKTRMVGKLALGSESSRQTQNPERGRKPASGKSVRSKRFQRVVRPKTPRGDGNSKSSTTSAAAACSRSRQTQNPERGRKLNNTFFERGAVESVVRPKTPRGDGNTETQHQPDNLILASSDLKPREGTETPRGWRMRCARKCRQTQNPERGRKPDDGQ